MKRFGEVSSRQNMSKMLHCKINASPSSWEWGRVGSVNGFHSFAGITCAAIVRTTETGP